MDEELGIASIIIGLFVLWCVGGFVFEAISSAAGWAFLIFSFVSFGLSAIFFGIRTIWPTND